MHSIAYSGRCAHKLQSMRAFSQTPQTIPSVVRSSDKGFRKTRFLRLGSRIKLGCMNVHARAGMSSKEIRLSHFLLFSRFIRTILR